MGELAKQELVKSWICSKSPHKRYDKRVSTKQELWNNLFFPKRILFRSVAVAAAATPHKRYDKKTFTKQELWNNWISPKTFWQICSGCCCCRNTANGMVNNFSQSKNHDTTCFPKRKCSDLLRLLLLPQHPTNGMISESLQNKNYETNRFPKKHFVKICCVCCCCCCKTS